MESRRRWDREGDEEDDGDGKEIEIGREMKKLTEEPLPPPLILVAHYL
jgi:hypothetical protein